MRNPIRKSLTKFSSASIGKQTVSEILYSAFPSRPYPSAESIRGNPRRRDPLPCKHLTPTRPRNQIAFKEGAFKGAFKEGESGCNLWRRPSQIQIDCCSPSHPELTV